ncbi:hypothetical protein VTO42DRAFT_712 [Malbranchea cinnamomea]
MFIDPYFSIGQEQTRRRGKERKKNKNKKSCRVMRTRRVGRGDGGGGGDDGERRYNMKTDEAAGEAEDDGARGGVNCRREGEDERMRSAKRRKEGREGKKRKKKRKKVGTGWAIVRESGRGRGRDRVVFTHLLLEWFRVVRGPGGGGWGAAKLGAWERARVE